MRILLTIIFLFSKILSQSIDEKFYAGNNFYNNSKYLEAIEIYEQILLKGWGSSNLYYNLGNAYFRQNQIGQSIWAYHKALKMNPRNSDLSYNLEIANARIKDRIILPDEFFLLDLYRDIKSRYTFNEWLIIGSITILFTVLIFIVSKTYLFNNIVLERVIVFFLIFVLIEHGIILDRFFEENDNKLGVIIDNEVDAYSGPFYGDNSILFKINEGTMVKIGQDQKNWLEIILLDGNRGWIPLEKVRSL
ncbi:MAG: tetratricopeptide repeat protein [Candidatus Neomarinimicrobiota bacterium]|nr:tetratricopeptide repeat protein [Candidatus Neomarinimicrobiota bacterium]